jgi:hypothetical protein
VSWFRWILAACLICTVCVVTQKSAKAGAIAEGPNVRVTDATLGDNNAEHVRMVEHEGTLYAVWLDKRDGAYALIYFAKSTNSGESWGPNIRISDVTYEDWANYPDITVQPDGTIWIVWHLFYAVGSENVNDIRIAKSTDGGETFAVDNFLNGVDGDSDLWRSRIVADASNGALYIMTQLYGVSGTDEGTDLFLIRYDPESDSWLDALINDVPRAGRLRTDTTLDYAPWFSLTARDGIVCAAWEDRGRNLGERQPIYGACSSDGGASFGPNFKLSEDDGVQPEIALGPDGELYAAYAIDTDSHRNIKVRLSTDMGATWGPTRAVTAIDSDEIHDWAIGVDGNGQLLLAYTLEDLNNLFLVTSIDQGENFAFLPLYDEQGEYPLSTGHHHPTLAIGGTGDETRAYVAWEDDRNLNYEIWSQRIILDSLPPSVPQNLTLTPEERAVRLQWDAATDTNGVAGYRVYRATSADGPFTEITPRLVMATSYVDVELDETTYFYRVAAVDGTANTSAPSAIVSGAAAAPEDPTFGGKIAYEAGDNIRIRNITGEPNERTISDARQPRFATNGESIYYYSESTISHQPIDGGAPEIFFSDENLYEYDLAGNESHYGVIIGRSFVAPGAVGNTCFVSEPHYGRPGQNIYTEQYDYGSEIALSNDRKWLVYRTAGFCNIAASGAYFPPKLCFIDLNTQERTCAEGYDYRTPDFAPTGHWLAFAVDFTGQEEIWKAQVQPNGTLSNFVQLTSGPAGQPSRTPSWSTDGNWLIFQRDVAPGEAEDWRLYVVRNDGVGVRALDLAGESPAWLGGGPSAPPDVDGARLHLPILSRP